METDVLGPPYEQHTIDLGTDEEGPVTATLVRRRATTPTRTAVLYVHGFVDYFFQTHLADFFTDAGVDFYALDLRKHGRSLAPHQTPNFCHDVREYYAELDEAARFIREEDGHDRLLVNGHSTGGLITALWAHDRRTDSPADALFLNSPFLDLNAPWLLRRLGAPVTTGVGRYRPKARIPFSLNDVYGRSIHRNHGGDWDYDLEWKPLTGFPVRAGWLRAIRAAQRRVHAGLDIRVPILVAASTASYKRARWSDAARAADSVLDVDHMARWAPALGRCVTLVRIEGGLHDLTLSTDTARSQLFTEVGRWLPAYGDVARTG
ncbi:MAG TPA: alpha/beta hydrolase [Micromonosporaceae bacterium]|nr:alpha/beta hydrolase [Micromonosporaceae bacterium]